MFIKSIVMHKTTPIFCIFSFSCLKKKNYNRTFLWFNGCLRLRIGSKLAANTLARALEFVTDDLSFILYTRKNHDRVINSF